LPAPAARRKGSGAACAASAVPVRTPASACQLPPVFESCTATARLWCGPSLFPTRKRRRAVPSVYVLPGRTPDRSGSATKTFENGFDLVARSLPEIDSLVLKFSYFFQRECRPTAKFTTDSIPFSESLSRRQVDRNHAERLFHRVPGAQDEGGKYPLPIPSIRFYHTPAGRTSKIDK